MGSQTRKKPRVSCMSYALIVVLLVTCVWCVLGILRFGQTPTMKRIMPFKDKLMESFSIAANNTQAKTNWKEEQKLSNAAKPIFAIAACTHSAPRWKSLNDCSLQTLLIPSIEATVTQEELALWDVRLYVGIDHDDTFWRKHIKNLNGTEWLTVHHEFYDVPEHKIPFNAMMKHAIEDGAEYLARMNDDSEFVTNGWITQGVAALRGFHPSNVGVVGPTCKQGNTAIMTHDMVHRTHLDIFENYYPTTFSAWWIDDWITKVYQPVRSTQLKTWEVKHHTGKHGTRYKVQHQEGKLLTEELRKGKKKVEDWLNNHTAVYQKNGSV